MNFDEFKTWLKAHTRKFSSVDVFLHGLKTRKTEVTKDWFRTLARVSLEDALNATERMYASEKLRNEFPQNHPAKIRELVSGITAARFDGEASKCICGGSGFVDVVNVLGCFKTPLGNVITAETVTVACRCDIGKGVRLKHEDAHGLQPKDRPPPIVQFDPECMTTWEQHLREEKNGMIVYDPEVTQKVASGWGSLPEYQPEIYAVREPGEEG